MDTSQDTLFCTEPSGRGKTGRICHTQCKHKVIPIPLLVVAMQPWRRLQDGAVRMQIWVLRGSGRAPWHIVVTSQLFSEEKHFRTTPARSRNDQEVLVWDMSTGFLPSENHIICGKIFFWTWRPGNRLLSGSVPHHLLVHLSNPLTNPCPESLFGKL